MEQFKNFEKQYKTFGGYLSDDPQIKYFDSGACKCTFSIPLKENKDATPVWLNCECWGHIAETIAERYHKNSEITVIGYFKESEYNGKTYLNFIVKVAM